jgi:hypothetical protein
VSRPQGFSPKIRRLVADRASDYNGAPVCEIWAICQGVAAQAVHHRRPRAAGGTRRPETNQPANGLASCDPCHEWVESNRGQAKKFGWLLTQSEVPAARPVLRRGRWVLLADDGSIHLYERSSL